MTFTNSNNNNSEGKFSKTFSSSLGSPASTSSTSGSSFGTNAGTSTKPSTFTAGTGSTLSSAAAKPAGFGGATASAASQFAYGKTSVPSASSAFSSTAQSKTVPLTSVSSATAARPAALSPSPVPPTPASASTASAAGSSMARPSTLGTAPNASATSAATATTARPSAFTATSTTAARPSAFGTTAQPSSSAGAATRPSVFTSSMAATASAASTAATRTSSFTSTVSTAVRPSAFTATSATSVSGTLGSRTSAPVSSDEFAKKFAETRAALSTAKRSPLHSGSSDAGNAPAVEPGQEVTDVQYRRFAAFIEEKCGIVLGAGKQYLVNSRLSTLLSKFGISNVDELINKAMENTPNNKIQEAVIDAMTTNETLWFRDTYPYTALEQFILPELAKKGKYPVRIWSAACSSGQEPYSIGIVVQEQMAKMLHIDPKQTQIIGTDLSPEMLATCKLGQYDVHALSRGLSAERKSKFFKPTRNPNIMQIDPRVKSMVEFRPMNLLGSYALMGKFDVIFCRNVLIYFSNDVKAEILRKLTMCLNPGGYLILGSTETLVGVADKYEMVRHSPGILYRLKPQKFVF
ncbi:CheR family methyltransferase [Succinivibrio dextrinosolvens]|uniref:protein-glutamate O-methyltransferase n=1 Tax=Succinivibrio dextrinosolvens TaxID=83771 RepID=A0A662Z8H0_9GAMM|nr:protein-glutamate O-methyltransferase CheR [Succinivibrio dextrinosolvens]SFK00011.1 Methylase of chemotaxis methyl-accepting proteins [Succinivibrio dextrinosolvens]